MIEETIGILVILISSGTLYFSATARHRLTTLEKDVSAQGKTLVKVQTDIAYLKGQKEI